MTRRMPPSGSIGTWGKWGALLVLGTMASACVATNRRSHAAATLDYFPLTPTSRWEYVLNRRAGNSPVRLVANVRTNDLQGPNGHGCRIVDEHYGDGPEDERTPIVYCLEDTFLHRVTSFEYRGDALEDTGLRAGEVRFLPLDLAGTPSWEGRTSSYRLADGSGFEVRQLHRVFVQNEPIDVPAGRFERCARVETTAMHSATSPEGSPVGPHIVYYYSDWYAAGVGLVRTEQRNAGHEVVATVELVSYHVAEASRR